MNSRQIKFIALFTMVIDHVGLTLDVLYRFKQYGSDFALYTDNTFYFLRIIGRMAFPLFAFLIAQGCAFSKDIKKYIMRLLLFAALSQVPYMLFTNIAYGSENLFYYTHLNVLFTLAFGAIAVLLYQKAVLAGRFSFLYAIGIFICFFIVLLFNSEYDIYGVCVILFCYILRPKNETDADYKIIGSYYLQGFAVGLISIIFYKSSILACISVAIAAFIVAFNNGEQGKKGKKGKKWFFYIFYPSHQLILSLVMFLSIYK